MVINTKCCSIMPYSYKMKLIEGVYILALVVCLVGNGSCISSGTPVTSISGFQYQAAVLCPVIMCSGAIVSPKNVLTTATCINNVLPEDVEVYVGSVQYYNGGYTYNVANIVMHPSFSPSTYDYNIAVLTVGTPFNLNIVVPIPLASVAVPTGQYVLTTAYGAINANLDLPDVLQRAYLLKYSPAECQLKKQNRLTSTMFCMGDTKGSKDLCPADQGAPAVYNGNLVGIYSWGCSCGLASPNPSSPVFTSIPYLKSWITNTIASSA